MSAADHAQRSHAPHKSSTHKTVSAVHISNLVYTDKIHAGISGVKKKWGWRSVAAVDHALRSHTPHKSSTQKMVSAVHVSNLVYYNKAHACI